MNLWERLPLSIIHIIYEYDSTYHDIFRKTVIPFLRYEFHHEGDCIRDRYNPMTGHYIYYHQSNAIMSPLVKRHEEYLINGLLNGRRVDYHTNGTINIISVWKNHRLHGPRSEYDPSGILRKESFYQEGKEEGVSRHYFDNGMLFQICGYQKGKREGEFIQYHKNGSMKKQALYQNDNLVKLYYKQNISI